MTAPYDPNWANRPTQGDGPPGQGWQQPGWQPQWEQQGQWQPQGQQPQGQQPPWEQQPQGWSAPQQGWQQPQQQGFPPDPYAGNAGWQHPGAAPLMPAAPPKRRGKAIALAAAAVVLIGGGVATYAAVSSTDSASGGSKSPKAAVQKMFADLQSSDVIGALDDLPPGERAAVSTPFKEEVAQLKRNDVLKPGADLHKLAGISFATSGLTYDNGTDVVNDHVQVVQLTGGKITVSGNAAKLPFTGDFLRAIGRGQSPLTGTSGTKTIDIADIVKQTHKPVRLATQKVDGSWYPSLFYTVADNATVQSGQQAPSAADAVPAVGASSADAAVRTMIQSLLAGNLRSALELMSPDELQVVHDYGKLIMDQTHLSSAGVELKEIQFADTAISGGTRVSLKSLHIAGPNGEDASVEVDGSCLKVSDSGENRTLCGSQLAQSLGAAGSNLTQAQRTAISDLFAGISKIGVVATEHDGQWFVNPVRSFAEVGSTLLAGLKDGDMKALLGLAHR